MPLHIYKNAEGKRIPGVTTIIANLGWNKNALMYWAWEEGLNGKNFRETSQEAADIGTIGHAMVEADLKNKDWRSLVDLRDVTEEMVEQATRTFQAWLQWKKLFNFELVASEISLISEQWQIGGTIDVATIQGEVSLVDLKTSNAIYEDHKIQIAAYGRLWNENFPDKQIKAYYILQLGKKDGSFHYHFWPRLDEAWEAFVCLRKLHNLRKKIA